MKIFYTPLVTKYPTIFLSASKYRMNQRFTYQHSYIKMEKTQFHKVSYQLIVVLYRSNGIVTEHLLQVITSDMYTSYS